MAGGVQLAMLLALGGAFASIVLGRNLTRSMTAGALAIVGITGALLGAGAGFVALFVCTVLALVLATIQLFGWMLVDVDRDHLPPTDRATWIARSIAFLLLGGGLVLLTVAALDQGVLTPATSPAAFAEPAEIGALLFGPWRELATLCGLAIAAGLLASLMLLRDDGERR